MRHRLEPCVIFILAGKKPAIPSWFHTQVSLEAALMKEILEDRPNEP